MKRRYEKALNSADKGYTSAIQKDIEDFFDLINKLYPQGQNNIVLLGMQGLFKSPQSIKQLAKYNNYQIMNLIIEHKDLNSLNHIFEKLDDKTKFLVTCHNNYALIHKLVEVLSNDIVNNQYNKITSKELFKTLIAVKPSILSDEVSSIIVDKERKFPILKTIFSNTAKEVISELNMNGKKLENSFTNRIKKQEKELRIVTK